MDSSFDSWIDKKGIIQISEYFQEPKYLRRKVKIDLVLCNYVTIKADLNSDVDKLDIDKLKNVPVGLNTLKSKVDKLNIGKLQSTPIDLSKLSDVVKIEVVKKIVYGELDSKLNAVKTTDTGDLVNRY